MNLSQRPQMVANHSIHRIAKFLPKIAIRPHQQQTCDRYGHVIEQNGKNWKRKAEGEKKIVYPEQFN